MLRKPALPFGGALGPSAFINQPGSKHILGSITGLVTDPSGGLVIKAQITVTNSGTGSVRQVATGTTGVLVPSLDVGLTCCASERLALLLMKGLDSTWNPTRS
jgi:hypothetical protein